MAGVLLAAVIGAVVIVVVATLKAGGGRRARSSQARSSNEAVARAVVTQSVEGGNFVVQVDRPPQRHRVLWRIEGPRAAETNFDIKVGEETVPVTVPANMSLDMVAAEINKIASGLFSAARQDPENANPGICLTSARFGSAGRLEITGVRTQELDDQNGGCLDAVVHVNGDRVATKNDYVKLAQDVSAQIGSPGSAEITVGPAAATGRSPLWFLGLPPTVPTGGAVLLYRSLRLQLWVGALLVVAGGVGGMYYGTTQGSVKGQIAALVAQAGITTTSSPTTSPKSTTTNSTTTPSSTPTAGGATTTSSTSTTGPTTGTTTAQLTAQNPATPGGSTSSTVALVQGIALAMVAAGATMIPTGAIGMLAAKIKDDGIQ